MSTQEVSLIFSGAVVLGYLAIAVFFLRFWRQTRERLFMWFALAFVILGAERVMLIAPPFAWVHQPQFYCTRLIAFLMIACAIWDKNRQRS